MSWKENVSLYRTLMREYRSTLTKLAGNYGSVVSFHFSRTVSPQQEAMWLVEWVYKE